MIIRCEGCAAKYFLPDAKVPADPTRVRCPRCKAVFTLAPNVVAGVEEPVIKSVAKSAEAVMEPQGASTPLPDDGGRDAAEPVAAVSETAKPSIEAQSAPTPGPSKEAAKVPKRTRKRKGDKADDRARRLARVLVSDILCYNTEKRDQALIDGNLMTVLGDDIKKSWELYKEKVGPEVAKSTNYFKEALNEILADGQKVF